MAAGRNELTTSDQRIKLALINTVMSPEEYANLARMSSNLLQELTSVPDAMQLVNAIRVGNQYLDQQSLRCMAQSSYGQTANQATQAINTYNAELEQLDLLLALIRRQGDALRNIHDKAIRNYCDICQQVSDLYQELGFQFYQTFIMDTMSPTDRASLHKSAFHSYLFSIHYYLKLLAQFDSGMSYKTHEETLSMTKIGLLLSKEAITKRASRINSFFNVEYLNLCYQRMIEILMIYYHTLTRSESINGDELTKIAPDITTTMALAEQLSPTTQNQLTNAHSQNEKSRLTKYRQAKLLSPSDLVWHLLLARVAALQNDIHSAKGHITKCIQNFENIINVRMRDHEATLPEIQKYLIILNITDELKQTEIHKAYLKRLNDLDSELQKKKREKSNLVDKNNYLYYINHLEFMYMSFDLAEFIRKYTKQRPVLTEKVTEYQKDSIIKTNLCVEVEPFTLLAINVDKNPILLTVTVDEFYDAGMSFMAEDTLGAGRPTLLETTQQYFVQALHMIKEQYPDIATTTDALMTVLPTTIKTALYPGLYYDHDFITARITANVQQLMATNSSKNEELLIHHRQHYKISCKLNACRLMLAEHYLSNANEIRDQSFYRDTLIANVYFMSVIISIIDLFIKNEARYASQLDSDQLFILTKAYYGIARTQLNLYLHDGRKGHLDHAGIIIEQHNHYLALTANLMEYNIAHESRDDIRRFFIEQRQLCCKQRVAVGELLNSIYECRLLRVGNDYESAIQLHLSIARQCKEDGQIIAELMCGHINNNDLLAIIKNTNSIKTNEFLDNLNAELLGDYIAKAELCFSSYHDAVEFCNRGALVAGELEKKRLFLNLRDQVQGTFYEILMHTGDISRTLALSNSQHTAIVAKCHEKIRNNLFYALLPLIKEPKENTLLIDIVRLQMIKFAKNVSRVLQTGIEINISQLRNQAGFYPETTKSKENKNRLLDEFKTITTVYEHALRLALQYLIIAKNIEDIGKLKDCKMDYNYKSLHPYFKNTELLLAADNQSSATMIAAEACCDIYNCFIMLNSIRTRCTMRAIIPGPDHLNIEDVILAVNDNYSIIGSIATQTSLQNQLVCQVIPAEFKRRTHASCYAHAIELAEITMRQFKDQKQPYNKTAHLYIDDAIDHLMIFISTHPKKSDFNEIRNALLVARANLKKIKSFDNAIPYIDALDELAQQINQVFLYAEVQVKTITPVTPSLEEKAATDKEEKIYSSPMETLVHHSTPDEEVKSQKQKEQRRDELEKRLLREKSQRAADVQRKARQKEERKKELARKKIDRELQAVQDEEMRLAELERDKKAAEQIETERKIKLEQELIAKQRLEELKRQELQEKILREKEATAIALKLAHTQAEKQTEKQAEKLPPIIIPEVQHEPITIALTQSKASTAQVIQQLSPSQAEKLPPIIISEVQHEPITIAPTQPKASTAQVIQQLSPSTTIISQSKVTAESHPAYELFTAIAATARDATQEEALFAIAKKFKATIPDKPLQVTGREVMEYRSRLKQLICSGYATSVINLLLQHDLYDYFFPAFLIMQQNTLLTTHIQLWLLTRLCSFDVGIKNGTTTQREALSCFIAASCISLQPANFLNMELAEINHLTAPFAAFNEIVDYHSPSSGELKGEMHLIRTLMQEFIATLAAALNPSTYGPPVVVPLIGSVASPHHVNQPNSALFFASSPIHQNGTNQVLPYLNDPGSSMPTSAHYHPNR